uniref:EF-hand domain-containing protein n=2 Tax=Rhodosorus marinus TaxID=101924 RepID=A0A7S2ZCR7_9RHOD|mmetsp:Transcript_13698/g.54829  ORF Transcript_13698/g.54829 Transcript_13698/m.54829 type:complete len:157 (+) Transcript_13698:417-887(+)|eukprot:CAMPEP_0113953820 /NCGR_PEP_ID=MMETSP0011_2-20120614/63_1 /TAXON_ID=101924 /ORGANISM="Rhodosorus marinus" /LENGTH=156 /DNA_ID=CAMNT_0000962587 /DNA_START=146 /DNA_END=616 /DNA_ORIENTATION=- /assembly_acc=CAM_ASM_000156
MGLNQVDYLVKEKRKELEVIFNMFDEDADQMMNINELSTFLKAVGLEKSPSEVSKILRYHDADLSGLLSFDEWVVLVTVDLAGKSLQDESLFNAFKKIDTDMDGYIFESELKEFANLTDAEAKALFEQMDLNMDGRVNFVEFLFQFFHDSDIVVEK